EVAEHRHHDVDPAGRQPDGVGKSFLLDLEKLVNRTARAGYLGQRSRVLGVVEMEEVDAIEAERLQALLEGAAGLGAVEAPGLDIAIELGRDDEAGRQPAALAD